MTEDLFSSEERLERLPVQDAEIYYLRTLALSESPNSLARTLAAVTPWRAEKIVVWGKSYQQPRLVAWYGDAGRIYTYSGIQMEPLPWTDGLLDVKRRVEAIAGVIFNSVLLNYYRDHRDSMGLHSDDEPELGWQPVIASVSLGEERTLIFKHKRNVNIKPVRLLLSSGSLLVMRGDTQRNWKHGINKEAKPCGARVNLTFRRIQDKGV